MEKIEINFEFEASKSEQKYIHNELKKLKSKYHRLSRRNTMPIDEKTAKQLEKATHQSVMSRFLSKIKMIFSDKNDFI